MCLLNFTLFCALKVSDFTIIFSNMQNLPQKDCSHASHLIWRILYLIIWSLMSYESPQEYGMFLVCVKYKSMYNMPVQDKQSWMLYKISFSSAKCTSNLFNWGACCFDNGSIGYITWIVAMNVHLHSVIRHHSSDVYLGMFPVQNGGSYLMY